MKDQILQHINAVAQGFKNALCSSADYFKKKYQLNLQNLQQQQQYLQQQNLNSRITTLQTEIQQELFDVMSQCQYTILHPIHLLTHIRPAGWRLTSQGVIYRFILSGTQNPAQFILTNLKNNINLDIYNYNKNLIATMPFQFAQMLHPHIISGLYVLNASAVCNNIYLYVASNVVP